MRKLRKIKFKEFVKLQRGFDLPKKDMVDGPYPVMGSTSIIGYHKEYKQKPPGVITGRSGSLGKLQYINKKYWPHNTSLWIKDFKGNFPKYVYYFLHSIDFENFNAGVGVPTLNRNHLDNYDIETHEIDDQKKIATILSNYDNLIENNTKRIQLLEKMAKLIYDEWFVKFKFPGHENVRMVDSELGEIPEGWEVKCIREIISKYIGGGWGKDKPIKDFNKEAFVIRGTDFPKIGLGRVEEIPLRYNKESNFKSRKLQNFDLVFEVSGGSKDQPVGRSILILNQLLDKLEGDVMFASFCKLIRLNDSVSPYHFDLFLSNLYYSRKITEFQVQSTGISNFKFEAFLDKMKMVIPSQEIKNKFHAMMDIIYNEKLNLALKNNILTKTRDMLRPKLISGHVDVSDLDIQVPEVEA